MRVIVLTTETPHHAHYVRELAHNVDIVCVFAETTSVLPSFDTHHEFENLRDQYEVESWFGGNAPSLRDYAPVRAVPTINNNQVNRAIADLAADIIFVFGTAKLDPLPVNGHPNRILNLHGGDPEEYRGLDTHLWSIYHRDIDRLVSTLHHLDSDLDTGDIVLQQQLAIQPEMELHQLRRINTEACVFMGLVALDMVTDRGKLVGRKQRKLGRYYSFMPAALKE